MSFLGAIVGAFAGAAPQDEVTPVQEPVKVFVPKPSLEQAVSLLKRCVQETHFSPLYYGYPDLYREIWNFIMRDAESRAP